MSPVDIPAAVVDRVELDRIRIFFGHASGNMPSIMVGAALIAAALYQGGVALATLGAWMGLLGLASAGVAWFERHVQRIGLSADNCRRLLRTRIGLGAVVALFYGMAGFLLPDGVAHVEDTFLFVILSTVVTVGALGYAVVPTYYLTLSYLSLLPLMVHFLYRYLAHADDFYLLLVVLVLAWQAIVLRKARQVSGTSIEAIVLTTRLRDEIDEHKRTRESMRHMALHDALTGLGNRRYFDETMTRTLGQAARDAAHVGLLSVDLNDFKPVNDRHGHAVGDALLQAVAQRLREVSRAGDFCARMGGDEFSVLVSGARAESDMAGLAGKLRAVLAQAYLLDGVAVHISASIGWAVYPQDGQTAAQLMLVADQRMYSEKPAAKARHQPAQALPTPAIAR